MERLRYGQLGTGRRLTALCSVRWPGLEVIQAARRRYGPKTPIIVITAYGSVHNAVEAMRTGATDYLEKPFDMADLRTCLAKWLRNNSPLGGLGASAE